jgi:hypothetical protein
MSPMSRENWTSLIGRLFDFLDRDDIALLIDNEASAHRAH